MNEEGGMAPPVALVGGGPCGGSNPDTGPGSRSRQRAVKLVCGSHPAQRSRRPNVAGAMGTAARSWRRAGAQSWGAQGRGGGLCRAGRRAEQAEASACTADESRRTITGEIKHPRPTAIPSVGERVEMHLWEVVWKD